MKIQLGTTIHLLERSNLRHWQHQMLASMWSKRSSHSWLVGKQDGTATAEDSLVVWWFLTKPNILSIQSSNHDPQYLLKTLSDIQCGAT